MIQKLIYTSFLLLFCAAMMQAQPVIQANIAPEIGDVVTYTQADTNNVSVGNAGANQTWNFATLQPLSGNSTSQQEYIAVAGTPYAAMYPAANLALLVEENPNVYAYYLKQPDRLTILGLASEDFVQLYSDPEAVLRFPITFTQTLEDDFAYTVDAGAGVVTYTEGSRTFTYDAYGTLTTPLGTFNNTMRYKAESVQIDSAEFGGTQLVNQTFTTTYGWLIANYPGTLVAVYDIWTISETRIPGFDTIVTESPRTKSVQYTSSGTVGAINAPNSVAGLSDLTLGPNPAVDQLTLRFNADREISNLQLQLLGANGQLLQTRVFNAIPGENTLPLPVESFSQGFYWLTLTDGKSMQSLPWQKF
jgi:hypothetical protein